MDQPTPHLGVRRIQDIFRNNKHRLYHWSEDRKVPADNNLAERDLRPSVIARKVSFSSVSDAGAQTRSTLTTVVTTQKKRRLYPGQHVTITQGLLARDPTQDAYPVLFPIPDQEKASDVSPLQKSYISDP